MALDRSGIHRNRSAAVHNHDKVEVALFIYQAGQLVRQIEVELRVARSGEEQPGAVAVIADADAVLVSGASSSNSMESELTSLPASPWTWYSAQAGSVAVLARIACMPSTVAPKLSKKSLPLISAISLAPCTGAPLSAGSTGKVEPDALA